MSVYVVADIHVEDATKFDDYKSKAPGTIAAHGGRYVVRTGQVETLEGTWSPSRLVIIEFPSAADAKAWWNSQEYEKLKAIRRPCSRGQFLMVEGA